MSRTLIFGGSFDPYHLGHDAVITALHAAYPEDHILALPSANTPGKVAHSPSLQRLEILQGALPALPSLTIDDRELFEPGPNFTVDTVLALCAIYPRLILVIGYDQFAQFPFWHDPARIMALVEGLIVINRGETTAIPPFFSDIYRDQLHFLYIPPCPFSSDKIRNSLYHGESDIPGLSQHTLSYINSHNLYRPSDKTVIGVTGRVGSGKSTAAAYAMRHAPVVVIDLDKLGHYVLTRADIIAQLVASFGTGDRKALSEIVFSDPEQLAQLNAIVHPPLSALAKQHLDQSMAHHILLVGALIEELGLTPCCSRMIVIDADPAIVETMIGPKFLQVSQFQRSREIYLATADTVVLNTFCPEFGPTFLEVLSL